MRLSHRPPRPTPGRRARGDHGYVLAKFALLLVPLLLMTGLSVDVGYWYHNASNLQKAADAAALAGVVWLPNELKAEEYAVAAAARNGYVHGTNGVTVEVTPIPGKTRRLRVTITDPNVSSFFFKNLGGRDIDIDRSALAEYVLAVPLGSPRNFFGLGDISTTEGRDNLYMAISAWCTSKADGDRYQARYEGNSNSGSTSECPRSSTSDLNPEYRTSGYEVYIEAPEGRTKAIDVLLYDARYNPNSSAAEDSNLTGGTQKDHSYNFQLYSPGLNALDDRDNVLFCQRTFTASTAYEAISFLGRSTGWNKLCTIPSTATSGRWVLRMTNTPRTSTSGGEATGSNTYGVVARFANEGVCDGRVTTSMCPRVYGKDAISVRAFDTSSTADFYLAEIDRIHTGKTLLLELFDPGEGGNSIRIRRPTSKTTWADATFSWSAAGVGSGTNVQSLDVTGSKFNGKLVEIEVDLTGYNPPTDNQWWQVRYQFNTGSVTDRTTWSARLLGDPVHLIEEEAQ